MDKLLRGLGNFIRHRRPGLRATFKRLAHGQEPVALLLACSDSRVVPSLLLGTDPGDIFEVRTVGNIIAPAGAGGAASVGDESEAAALEYAILALDVKHIVVMGHSGCGAMKAVLTGHVPQGATNLERWLVHARGASERLAESALIDRALAPADRLSQANVLQQLDHIQSYAVVAGRLAQGAVELHGAWFDVEQADLHVWNREQRRFLLADEAAVAGALARRASAPRSTS
jgi:carbonic anhydrase